MLDKEIREYKESHTPILLDQWNPSIVDDEFTVSVLFGAHPGSLESQLIKDELYKFAKAVKDIYNLGKRIEALGTNSE